MASIPNTMAWYLELMHTPRIEFSHMVTRYIYSVIVTGISRSAIPLIDVGIPRQMRKMCRILHSVDFFHSESEDIARVLQENNSPRFVMPPMH